LPSEKPAKMPTNKPITNIIKTETTKTAALTIIIRYPSLFRRPAAARLIRQPPAECVTAAVIMAKPPAAPHIRAKPPAACTTTTLEIISGITCFFHVHHPY
jgi:hypothetical protein